MKDEDIFGMHLVRWIFIFILACIVLFSFATEDDSMFVKQRDKNIKDIPFANSTIGDSGCGVCCLANAYYLSTGETIEVQEIVDIYQKRYPDQRVKGTDPRFISYFCGVYNLEYKTAKLQDVPQLVIDGWAVIVELPKGTKWNEDSKHYILLTGFDGNEFYVADPSISKNKKAANKKSRATLDELATTSFYCIRR